MNSYMAALEAAFPIESIICCRKCGTRLKDFGPTKAPDNCPVCGVLNRSDDENIKGNE